MDPVVQIALILIALSVFLRLRYSFRKSRMGNKTDKIQSRLEQLRKKRDEE